MNESQNNEVITTAENQDQRTHKVLHDLKELIRRQKLIVDTMSFDYKNNKQIGDKLIKDLEESIFETHKILLDNKDIFETAQLK